MSRLTVSCGIQATILSEEFFTSPEVSSVAESSEVISSPHAIHYPLPSPAKRTASFVPNPEQPPIEATSVNRECPESTSSECSRTWDDLVQLVADKDPDLKKKVADRLVKALGAAIDILVEKLLACEFSDEACPIAESGVSTTASAGCSRCEARDERLLRLRDMKQLHVEVKASRHDGSSLRMEHRLAAAFRHCIYLTTDSCCRPPEVPTTSCGAAQLGWQILDHVLAE